MRTFTRWGVPLFGLTMLAIAACSSGGGGGGGTQNNDDDPPDGDSGPDTVVFSAGAPSTGFEPWISDGTVGGTFALGDFCEGDCDGKGPFEASDYAYLDGHWYFGAYDGGVATGTELYRSDGTAEGTELVEDINPGTALSLPAYLTALDGYVYFSADDGSADREAWRSNGSTTEMLDDLTDSDSLSSDIDPAFTLFGGNIYFGASDGDSVHLFRWTGGELTDEIAADTEDPEQLVVYDGRLYLVATGDGDGRELIRVTGVNPVNMNLNDSAIGSDASELVVFDGLLHFVADTGDGADLELYSFNGSALDRITDLFNDGDSNPHGLSVVDGKLLFVGYDGNDTNLYAYDGDDVQMVTTVYDGGPANLYQHVVSGGRMYFMVEVSVNAYELWVTNGEASGTVNLSEELGEDAKSCDSLYLIGPVQGGSLLFAHDPEASGNRTIWASDGTGDGTVEIDDTPVNNYSPCS